MLLPSSARPSSTLLLVTPARLARVDFAGRRRVRVAQQWTHAIGPSSILPETLPVAVAQTIKLGSPRLGPVSIVSPLLWTQVLRVPADVLAISTPAELRHAVALEAELESGISAFDCQLALAQLEVDDQGGGQFCTTQVAAAQQSELTAVVRSHRARLQRLVHPVALQLAEGTTSAQATSEALQWWDTLAADDDSWLEEFIGRWARMLARRDTDCLNCLQPQAASLSGRLQTIGSLLAIASGMGCLAWHYESRCRLADTTAAVQQLEQQQNQRTETLAAIKQLETKLVKLHKEVQDAQQARESVYRQIQQAMTVQHKQNARWSGLVDALSTAAQDCWVQRIEAASGHTMIHGIAPSHAEVHAFAARLEQLLRDNGWLVSPAATRALALGVYEFYIPLVPDDSSRGGTADGSEIVGPAAQDRSDNFTLAAVGSSSMNPHSSLPPRWIWLVGPSLVSIALLGRLSSTAQPRVPSRTRQAQPTEPPDIPGRLRSGCTPASRSSRAVALAGRATRIAADRPYATGGSPQRSESCHSAIGRACDRLGRHDLHFGTPPTALPKRSTAAERHLQIARRLASDYPANGQSCSHPQPVERGAAGGAWHVPGYADALDELKATAVGVRLVLEMNLIEGHSGLLDWSITVAVRSNLP